MEALEISIQFLNLFLNDPVEIRPAADYFLSQRHSRHYNSGHLCEFDIRLNKEQERFEGTMTCKRDH
ncbi:MAG: hypothetical protein SGI92_07205 [Bryobacteraceae bacterium]|nr:hypothetical protein [Bryobacteraceae bacterium]